MDFPEYNHAPPTASPTGLPQPWGDKLPRELGCMQRSVVVRGEATVCSATRPPPHKLNQKDK